MFAVFFGAYVWARAEDPELFRSAQEHLSQPSAAVNTLLLLTSSLCVAAAVKAARDGLRRYARPLLLAAIAGGLGFFGVKIVEYAELLGDGITPATNDFFMYYYVLTWLHLVHLLTGTGILVFCSFVVRREQLTEKQIGLLEGGGCFWHMVDLLWIVLFPLLYLMQ